MRPAPSPSRNEVIRTELCGNKKARLFFIIRESNCYIYLINMSYWVVQIGHYLWKVSGLYFVPYSAVCWPLQPFKHYFSHAEPLILYMGNAVWNGWYQYRNDLKFSERRVWANSVDTDQTAPLCPLGAVWSRFTLFTIPSASFGHNLLCGKTTLFEF